MKLNVIVAHDTNRVIGNSKSNSLPWYLPPDLKHFKKLTLGHPVIMGKNTYRSLPNQKPLPNRTNIVICSNPDEFEFPYNEYENQKDSPVLGFSDLTRAIIFCETWLQAKEAFVIGGARMYNEVLKKHQVDVVYRTLIDGTFEGDVKFPELKGDQWVLKPGDPLEYEGLTYYFDELVNTN
jgi:dihydrofolate reductase